jgi:hypothetical protein
MSKDKLTIKDIDKEVSKIELCEKLENLKTIANYSNTYKLVSEVREE